MAEELTYCAVHRDRETSLRCNKCGRLMCTECAVPTPVGYRCRECVRQHEDKFFTATQADYAIVFGTSFALTAIGAFVISAISFLLVAIIAAVPAGGAIGEAGIRATQKRRGRYSPQIAAAGALVGGAVGGVAHTFSVVSQRTGGRVELPLDLVVRATFSDLTLLIFIGIVTFMVYGRLRMRI